MTCTLLKQKQTKKSTVEGYCMPNEIKKMSLIIVGRFVFYLFEDVDFFVSQ